MKIKIVVVFLASLVCFGTAQAGFDESYKALQIRDYRTALMEAQKSADAGDPRAYYILGIIYQNGLSVQANLIEAFSWYEKAAKGGVSGAFAKMSWAYIRGLGIAKDKDKALAFARASAKVGDPEGFFLVHLVLTVNALGFLDENGRPDDAKYFKL